jgi:hypothetical protein
MHERQSDEQIADMLERAEDAGKYEAGLIEVDAMDLVRVLHEVIDGRADSRNDAAHTTRLHDGLLEWATTEAAAKAAWHAWYTSMEAQHRFVDRHRSKWEILDPEDQRLDQMIVQKVITAAIEAVHNGEEVAHGRGGPSAA